MSEQRKRLNLTVSPQFLHSDALIGINIIIGTIGCNNKFVCGYCSWFVVTNKIISVLNAPLLGDVRYTPLVLVNCEKIFLKTFSYCIFCIAFLATPVPLHKDYLIHFSTFDFFVFCESILLQTNTFIKNDLAENNHHADNDNT